jgi:hypothetical protein
VGRRKPKPPRLRREGQRPVVRESVETPLASNSKPSNKWGAVLKGTGGSLSTLAIVLIGKSPDGFAGYVCFGLGATLVAAGELLGHRG